MARVVWALICKKSIIDEKSKLTSLIEVTENINFYSEKWVEEGKGWSIIPGRYTLASYFMRSELDTPEMTSIRITIRSPSGKTHDSKVEFEINLTDNDRARAFINLNSILFIESGMYSYKIEALEDDDWMEVGQVAFSIQQLKSLPAT